VSEPGLPTLLVAAAIAALIVGFLKTSVGGGIGLVLTPTLSLVLPPAVVLALIAPMMTLADPITLRFYWRQWHARELTVLLPAMLAGVLAGTWVLALVSEPALRRLIGGGALAFAVVQLVVLLRPRAPVDRVSWLAGGAVGVAAGVASSVAHSGGVIIGPYLAARRLTPAANVATAGALVAVTNLLKLAGYWHIGFLDRSILLAALLAVPLLALGSWIGFHANRRVPRRGFALLLIAIAIVGSIRLLLAR
jgi:uncharacterized membrane protein YfcA